MSDLKTRKQRQAKYAERLKELGLVQVSAWVPEENRWVISRIAESARSDAAGVAAAYTTALVGESRREMADSFWRSGGERYALFKSVRDGERTVAVKVIPWRCRPILVAVAITPDTSEKEIARQHPALARILEMRRYHWETAEYRQMCIDLDLDPDEGRPVFRPRYKYLGEELVEWVASRFGDYEEPWENEPEDPPEWADDPERPRYNAHTRRLMALSAVCDFVDLLREDVIPTPALVDDVRRKFSHFPEGMLPMDAKLRAVAHSEDLLHLGRIARREGTRPPARHEGGMGSAAEIELLPSRYGTGGTTFVRSDETDGDDDGWPKRWYAHLRGVAVEPSAEALAHSSWLEIAVRKLRAQGVLFLPEAQVQEYLDIEGTYWVHGNGASYCPLKRPIREPSWGERMMWRLKAPPLPIDRELVRREAMHPIP